MDQDIPTRDVEWQLERAENALDNIRWEQDDDSVAESTSSDDVDDVEVLKGALRSALRIVEENE